MAPTRKRVSLTRIFCNVGAISWVQKGLLVDVVVVSVKIIHHGINVVEDEVFECHFSSAHCHRSLGAERVL